MTRVTTEQLGEKIKNVHPDFLEQRFNASERSKDRVKLGGVTIYVIKPTTLQTSSIIGKVKYPITAVKTRVLWHLKIVLHIVTGRMKKAEPEKRGLISLASEAAEDTWVINVNANLYASTGGDRFLITPSLKVYIFKTLKLKQEFLRD